MKIKKKNTTIPISGKIVDTENVEDKTSNAPSLRLLEEIISKQTKKELLWENSTNSTLSATDITLSSDDYDELEVQYCASSLYAVGDKSEVVKKGRSIQLSASLYDSDHKCMINVSRLIKRNSDTSFSVETAYYTNLTTTPNSGTDTRFCIPLKIYGIKWR